MPMDINANIRKSNSFFCLFCQTTTMVKILIAKDAENINVSFVIMKAIPFFPG
jgi:hypothetical protein